MLMKLHLCLAMFMVWMCAAASAQPPAWIHYQGRLMDGTNLVHGPVELGFSLFTSAAGGTLLFEDARNADIVDGLYEARIGEFPVLGNLMQALTNANVWLQVSVDGTPLSPRERLVAVPYALHVRGMLIDEQGNVLFNSGPQTLGAGVQSAVVGGGFGNRVEADIATVAGGGNNFAGGGALGGATVSGGFMNRALGQDATVGGGVQNRALGQGATIPGGEKNEAHSDYASIGGGFGNIATNSLHTVISGGLSNRAQQSANAFVGGGRNNRITDSVFSIIGSGRDNGIESSPESTIAGGQFNRIKPVSIGATIGGGYNHTVSNANFATIAGGNNHEAIGSYAFIGGGQGNKAIGNYATIPGGQFNTADANAFAAGSRAQALHQGAFVWGDTQFGEVASTQPDQVTFRAQNGYRLLGGAIRGNDNGLALVGPVAINAPVSDDDLRVRGGGISVMLESTDTTPVFLRFRRLGDAYGANYLAVGSGGQMVFRVNDGDRMVIQTNGFIGIGTANPTNRLHVNGNVQALAFITGSDRSQKENIQPVHADAILAKVADLPMATWSFIDEPGSTHLGPMAQDFHAAFGLGQTDTGIATVDADGVALAAIQALARREAEARTRLTEMNDEVRRLQADNAHLHEMVRDMMKRLQQVETKEQKTRL
jgi:hypothetical protein